MPDDIFRYIDPEVDTAFKRGIFNGIITPRPIGWISTVDEQGAPNLAPFSYFGLFSTLPPIIAFSCNTPEDRTFKDTLANVQATGEFVYNMATRALVREMNATSTPLPAGTDEFAYAGLEKLASVKVRPPRVRQSPVSLECRVDRIVRLGERAGEIPTHVTFGRVVAVHVREDHMDEKGYFMTEKAAPVARLGGQQYTVCAPPFELTRQFRRAAEESY